MQIEKVLLSIAQPPNATNALSEDLVRMIRERFPGLNIVWARSKEEYQANLADADVMFIYGVKPEELARATRLKWIHVPYAGVEKALFPELVESPIIVTKASGSSGIGIADQVFGGILYFSRGLFLARRLQIEHKWDQQAVGRQAGELDGATLGIVGFGDIGHEVAKRAHGFGMRVIATKRTAPTENEWPEVLDEFIPLDRKEEVFRRADYLVLAIPHTAETYHLVGERELGMMKREAIFVNVSRGKVVDEPALIRALQKGQIAGAALDVFEEEPLPPDSPLWDLPNVLVTPHMAGINPWYMRRATEIFIDNLERVLQGKPMMNTVDKRAGY
ncbi:MAG: D-2-hydroxyacid dehydrogenase [Firmicutes bacterium]|nr:D-2-hydroxyacid dehydrogenase [Bacillota bacterium]